MNKNLTEIVFILDRSGSMAVLASDTIGGFNALIAKQKKVPGDALVSTVLFSDESTLIHDRRAIADVQPLTAADYTACGSTALIDAIGGAIRHIGNIHKYARPEDVPAHTLFVITTDGMENSSYRYSSAQVKEMIERQQKKYGWEFLFLGANIDAVDTAAGIGIRRERAANYHADSAGTKLNYQVLDDTICHLRSCSSIDDDWQSAIDADYKKRGGAL